MARPFAVLHMGSGPLIGPPPPDRLRSVGLEPAPSPQLARVLTTPPSRHRSIRFSADALLSSHNQIDPFLSSHPFCVLRNDWRASKEPLCCPLTALRVHVHQLDASSQSIQSVASLTRPSHSSPCQYCPCQHCPCQHCPSQHCPCQHCPCQHYPCQSPGLPSSPNANRSRPRHSKSNQFHYSTVNMCIGKDNSGPGRILSCWAAHWLPDDILLDAG
jgi:hypothetical protein